MGRSGLSPSQEPGLGALDRELREARACVLTCDVSLPAARAEGMLRDTQSWTEDDSAQTQGPLEAPLRESQETSVTPQVEQRSPK